MLNRYKIIYVDGSEKTILAKDRLDAQHWFRMEGDHAHTFMCIDTDVEVPEVDDDA